MTETLSFRVPSGIRGKLIEQARRRNLPDLSSYLRQIAERAVASGDESALIGQVGEPAEIRNRADASQTHNLDLGKDGT